MLEVKVLVPSLKRAAWYFLGPKRSWVASFPKRAVAVVTRAWTLVIIATKIGR